MLRVTVELIEHGVGEPQTLSTLSILNDGSGNEEFGNYVAYLGSDHDNAVTVTEFPREAGHMELLLDVLLEMLASDISDEFCKGIRAGG